MIYAFTLSELSALMHIYGHASDSPAVKAVKNVRYTEGSVTGLISLGLIYDLPDVPPALTSEGTLLAKALFSPDSIVSFGRKNAFINQSYALGLHGLWYIFTYIPNKKTCLLYAYLSTPMLADWINEQLLKSYAPTARGGKFSVSLTYEEWLLYLASQVLFMKREQAPTKSASLYFNRSALTNPEISRFFKTGFYTLQLRKFSQAAAMLFSENKRFLDKVISSLIKKEIFISTRNTQGEETFTYSNQVIKYLDNDLLLDTAVFSIKKGGEFRTLLLCLRKTGITTIFDTGNEVHINTVTDIPWLTYLEQ